MSTQVVAKSALRKINGTFPYDCNLNIYKGCDHGCIYCFAQYTESYMHNANNNFFSDIKAKTNIPELLDRELSKPYWRGKVVNLGGVCDSYQTAEVEYGIMREVWKVLNKHKSPVVISTKSSLILRDLDLIDRLSKVAFVNIASTIITTDEKLALKLEPHASTPSERFKFLKEIKRGTQASTGVHIMPVIPILTDSHDNFKKIFQQSTSAETDYTVEYPLHLSGITRTRFMHFIKREFPQILNAFSVLYTDTNVNKDYQIKLMNKIRTIKLKFPLENGYVKPNFHKEDFIQLEIGGLL